MTLAHRPTSRPAHSLSARTFTALAAAGALTLSLAACGEESTKSSSSSSSATSAGSASSSSAASSGSASSGSGSATSSSAAVTDGNLDSVKVTEVKDKAPTVELTKKPFGVGAFARKTLKEGSGEASTEKQVVVLNYELVNGTDGKVLDESYTKKETAFDTGDSSLIPGLRKALTGVKKGERAVAALPPADAFGDQGNSNLGVAGTDTLVFLVDVVDIVSKLDKAEGKEVKPKDGLPVVKWQDGKPASFTMPKSDPPKDLVIQPLIEGTGAKVAKGDTVAVTYTGALYRDGKVFDSSFNRGTSFSFPVGGGKVIAGWDKGIEGQKVGSRVLLVVPPKEGYGDAGSGEIKGTDTIVFVVDILAKY